MHTEKTSSDATERAVSAGFARFVYINFYVKYRRTYMARTLIARLPRLFRSRS